MKRLVLELIFSAALIMTLFSCATKEVNEIPTNLSAAQLIQMGQDAESSSQYKNAEAYFLATIQRYGLDNSIYVEARYELGCCYMKEKMYSEAEGTFNEILSIYEDATAGSLPPEFQKLAEIKLNQIPD